MNRAIVANTGVHNGKMTNRKILKSPASFTVMIPF
jgi:hypothetical protein